MPRDMTQTPAPTEERTYTYEDMQRAQREAFVAGANWAPGTAVFPIQDAEGAARRRYPIKRKVPRVVELPTSEIYAATDPRMDGDVAFFRTEEHAREFDRLNIYSIPWLEGDDRAVIADLLANPYEEVEE